MDIFFIRHGQTDANANSLFAGGGLDVPINRVGRAEAERIAASDEFRALVPSPRVVYVSPMIRAGQTAAILFPHSEKRVVEDLREFKFGRFEGRSFAELKGDPAYIEWSSGADDSRCPDGGDSVSSCTERVSRAFEAILTERGAAGDDAPVVIVAHGGTAMAFLHAYIDPKRPFFSWVTPNCGVWHFNCVKKDGVPAVTVLRAPASDGTDYGMRYGVKA
jgi:alpha-ribazole phosphatase